MYKGKNRTLTCYHYILNIKITIFVTDVKTREFNSHNLEIALSIFKICIQNTTDVDKIRDIVSIDSTG